MAAKLVAYLVGVLTCAVAFFTMSLVASYTGTSHKINYCTAYNTLVDRGSMPDIKPGLHNAFLNSQAADEYASEVSATTITSPPADAEVCTV